MKHLSGRPLIERKCVYTTHIGDDNEVEREYAVAHYGSDAQRVFVEAPTGEIDLPYEDVLLLLDRLLYTHIVCLPIVGKFVEIHIISNIL